MTYRELLEIAKKYPNCHNGKCCNKRNKKNKPQENGCNEQSKPIEAEDKDKG